MLATSAQRVRLSARPFLLLLLLGAVASLSLPREWRRPLLQCQWFARASGTSWSGARVLRHCHCGLTSIVVPWRCQPSGRKKEEGRGECGFPAMATHHAARRAAALSPFSSERVRTRARVFRTQRDAVGLASGASPECWWLFRGNSGARARVFSRRARLGRRCPLCNVLQRTRCASSDLYFARPGMR